MVPLPHDLFSVRQNVVGEAAKGVGKWQLGRVNAVVRGRECEAC